MSGNTPGPAAGSLPSLSKGDRRRATFLLIDEARQAAGITQERLCEKARVHPTTYSRRRQAPDRWRDAHLNRLITALHELKAVDAAEREALRSRITGERRAA